MTADLIISQLLFLNAEDHKKDIKLFINSPGGSVTDGMDLIHLIQKLLLIQIKGRQQTLTYLSSAECNIQTIRLENPVNRSYNPISQLKIDVIQRLLL